MTSFEHSMTRSMPLPTPCIPGTRITVITEIIRWLTDEARTSNVFWLYGPIGMGKTAVMMSVKQEAQKLHLPFVGVLLDLEMSEWDRDLRSTVLGIAKSLADIDPGYKQFFEAGCDNHVVHFGTLEDVFGHLLGPLSSSRCPQQTLILLDGLDPSHLPLVQLILTVKLPVLWLIASRPFPQLVRLLGGQNSGCIALNIQCGGDVEAEEDIELILEHGLKEYGESFFDHKDTGSAIIELRKEASRCPRTAMGFLNFIRAAPQQDPRARLLELKLALTYGGAIFPIGNKQIYVMDEAYLCIVQRIHGLCPLQMHRIVIVAAQPFPLTTLELSMLLNVPESAVQAIVDQLYAVLATERVGNSNRELVRLYNHDFYGFLTNEHRSNEYSICYFEAYDSLLEACFHMFRNYFTRPAELTVAQHVTLRIAEHHALIHAVTYAWQYALEGGVSWEPFLSLNVGLDFLLRLSGRIPVLPFIAFLERLSRRSDIVRSTATADWGQDQQLMDACAGIATPMDFNIDWEEEEEIHNYELVNPFVQDKTPMYALLGHPYETVLVILAEEGVTIYSACDIGEL